MIKHGLPEDFAPRFHRYRRPKLLEENIYRLPDGKEFVPCTPTGTLAAGRHLYALVTIEQFEQNGRGSVFVRFDGKVFDYSSDVGDPEREMFDTGFTMDDLVRTGRYATRVSNTSGTRRTFISKKDNNRKG